jgi:hypothetical protein
MVTKGDSPMKGIKFKVYPKEEGIIHVFQAPYIVQEHGEERLRKGRSAIGKHYIFSNPKYVNNR